MSIFCRLILVFIRAGISISTTMYLTLYLYCAYPSSYCIRFDTDIVNQSDAIIIHITQYWSPNGSNRLFDLINSKFYSVPSAFFRVVQFEISADPLQNRFWNKPIVDDPVLVSNTKETVSYATAGPNTRITQLFINYQDNQRLDSLGFSSFVIDEFYSSHLNSIKFGISLGIVTSGFELATQIYNPTPGNPNGVDQDEYSTKGNDWI